MADGLAATPIAEVAPETPPLVSAEVAATEHDDVSAFMEAHTAKQQGKPLAKVASSVEPTAPKLSSRQRAINEAVERGTAAAAELQAENARLKADLQAARRVPAQPTKEEPAQPAAVIPAKGEPEYKRFMAMPDAPKLDDFESVADHTAAMSLFIADQRIAERAAQTAQQSQTFNAQRERFQGFTTRLQEAKTADPEFVDKLTPEVKAIQGFQPTGNTPRNFIGELLYDSPASPHILLHFSEHPDALAALEALPSHLAALPEGPQRAKLHMDHMFREFSRLEGRLESGSAAAPVAARVAPSPRREPESTSPITAAPPPPPTLSRAGRTTDPMESALKRDDISAFMALEFEKKAARRSA